MNLENGFFVLLVVDSLFFFYGDYRSLVVVSVIGDIEFFIKFFVFGRIDVKYKISKVGKESLGENSKYEFRLVFIILFGVFDDFVDGEFDFKWKVEKKEKLLIKSFEDGIKIMKIMKEVDKLLGEFENNFCVKDDGLENVLKEDSECLVVYLLDEKVCEKFFDSFFIVW